VSRPLSAVVGFGAVALLVVGSLLWPWEVRHSAPFGFNLTFDARRGLAVRGSYVEPNYPNFDRLDLDLRAYGPAADYDLTVNIRPAAPAAAPIRSIPLPTGGDRIWHRKGAFADPFVSVRFPAIPDSAGRRYYVWVEAGPRNRDDVVTLWSVKSYSRVAGWLVLWAALARDPAGPAPVWWQATVGGSLVGLALAFGWLLAALLGGARPASVVARDVL